MKMLMDSTNLDSGVTFAETAPREWTVSIDGDKRTITQEGGSFIAWIGSQDRHWCFDSALAACISDAIHHRDLHDRAEALRIQQAARFDRLTPEQFEYVLDCRESELAGLSVNSVGRADMLRDEIQMMKEARL